MKRVVLDSMFDELTPLQQLAMETVSSRFRLGHRFWTFQTNQAVTKTLRELENMGLINRLGGNVPYTDRVQMTELGREMMLLPDYVPPIAEKIWDEGYAAGEADAASLAYERQVGNAVEHLGRQPNPYRA